MRNLPTPSFNPISPDFATSQLLARGQAELAEAGAEKILEWVSDTFGSQVAFAPSWEEEDTVIHSLFEQAGISIHTMESIHRLLLPETWTPLAPHETVCQTFDGRVASAELWARFHLEHQCKIHEALIARYPLWIVSARRAQGCLLENMSIFSWIERFGVFRVAPLANWQTEQVRERVRQYKMKSRHRLPAWLESGIPSRASQHSDGNETMETQTPKLEKGPVMINLIDNLEDAARK